MDVNIRSESINDYKGITEVNDLAFGQINEGLLVEKLRNTDRFDRRLSLVAEYNNKIVGHILFYPVFIRYKSLNHESLSLAPMSVLPNYQNHRIGSRLIERGVETAKNLGYRSVTVLGHPEYYPKFGFRPASRWNIFAPFEVPDPAFMVLELEEGELEAVQGVVIYPKEFNEL